jgi:hypothetical protein
MILRRLSANLRTQNWTAIAIELVIVIVGVFIGTQVSNWNQNRLEKVKTERMLQQFVPELRNQVDFYNTNIHYYAITHRYAEIALAGWRGDPRVSDGQFVIAAYQASQISGIGINADAWSLTFGGEQIRDLDDTKVRRLLQTILTADYAPVDYTTVATRYREQVRHVIPNDVQDDIRRVCGDRNRWTEDGPSIVYLPDDCSLQLAPDKAAAAAAALRARPDLAHELNWHLAAVATYLQNFQALIVPIRELLGELTAASSSPPKRD